MGAYYRTLIAVIFLGMLNSCAKNKFFFRNNQFNTVRASTRPAPDSTGRTPAADPDTLIHFTTKKGFKGKLKEQDGYVTITPAKDLPAMQKEQRIILQSADADLAAHNAKIDLLKDKIFIPDVITKKADQDIAVRYFDSKPVLQTLSTPIKIRRQVNDPDNPSTPIPAQVSTGVNLGMAFGWKFSLNAYKPKPNLFGFKTSQVSFTPGVFYGLGATGLTKANTRNPVISVDRSVLSHGMGGFFMLGFNNINIGYSIGWDFATGPDKSGWIYQGKLWHGIALALDLIK